VRIDWDRRGWRLWDTDFDGESRIDPALQPLFVRFVHTPERGWLEVVDMAEMTEMQSLLAKLGEKQIALDNAVANETQMMTLLRAIKQGSFDLNRLQFNETGFTVLEAVEVEAEAVARDAEGNHDATG